MSGGELEPIHVHVIKGKRRKNATKIWVTEDGVELCNNNDKIPNNDLKKLLTYIHLNRREITREWNRFFKVK